jgi:site-specific DNA-methyltransferase (adenine-specific)
MNEELNKKYRSYIYNDHFQNYKRYNIPKAQLVIADIPYNIGLRAYASNVRWYKDGDNKNGKSKLACKEFFDTDKDFRISEFLHFCNRLLKPEPRLANQAGCMIVFCEYMQQFELIQKARDFGLNKYINLVFRKNYSAQVLKANMKIVGNSEYAVLLYRDKLPKFNNHRKMIFNCMDWESDGKDIEKLHPTQKPIKLLTKLIKVFTDENDIVIDPCAGSGSSIVSAIRSNRRAIGFEIKKDFYAQAKKWIDRELEIKEYGFDKSFLFQDKASLFFQEANNESL